eukprot:4888564-Amphidinium_carterae.2
MTATLQEFAPWDSLFTDSEHEETAASSTTRVEDGPNNPSPSKRSRTSERSNCIAVAEHSSSWTHVIRDAFDGIWDFKEAKLEKLNVETLCSGLGTPTIGLKVVRATLNRTSFQGFVHHLLFKTMSRRCPFAQN